MKFKIGLKLYASNRECVKWAKNHHDLGLIDYIELYIVPGDFRKYEQIWKCLKIPFIIHAAHSLHGVNLSKRSHAAVNRSAYLDAKRYADLLDSAIIIFHPGLTGDVTETMRQIRQLGDKRIVVENKPFVALDGRRCVGGSFEEIQYIMKNCGVGFCLDITHAIKYAYSLGIDYLEYLHKLMRLKPRLIHVCDGNSDFGLDEHLKLGAGNFDFVRIFKILALNRKPLPITLESFREDSDGLDDFVKEVKYVRSLWGDRKST
jgi:deoxyribonuclease-4